MAPRSIAAHVRRRLKRRRDGVFETHMATLGSLALSRKVVRSGPYVTRWTLVRQLHLDVRLAALREPHTSKFLFLPLTRWPADCNLSSEMQQGKLIVMENRAGTTAFVLDSPFDSALTRIRRALREDHLCIAAEINAAQRIKRALEIYVSPCRILLVDNPLFTLETTAIDRASGVFIPLHLVVSGVGDRTLVHMLSPHYVQSADFPIGVRTPVIGLQHQLLRTLTRIADRIRDTHELGDRGSDREAGRVC